ncbi:MAG: hypothetical protein WC843_06510 [Candidatus Gracilibacteria bacterium]|jgi:hypothetical protein
MNAPATMEELKKIFDDFNQAILAGDVDKAMQFVDIQSKKSFLEMFKTPEGKASILQMAPMMIPVSFTVSHLDQKGEKALLYITGALKTEDKKNSTQELMLRFNNEAGAWKFGGSLSLADLKDIKHVPDEKFEPESKFALNKTVSLGGRIVSVKFETDYTMVIIRVLDEENLIFLPKKADLGKTGIAADQLVPWKILSIHAHPHLSNKFKLIGDKVEIVEPSFEL